MPQKVLLESESVDIFRDEIRLAFGGTVAGRAVTTDATTTTLLTIPLRAGRTYLITVNVLARRTGGSAGTAEDGATYVLYGGYKAPSGTATVLSGSTPTVAFVSESQAGWDATLSVSGADVRVRVTGAANNNVTWIAKAYVEEVST